MLTGSTKGQYFCHLLTRRRLDEALVKHASEKFRDWSSARSTDPAGSTRPQNDRHVPAHVLNSSNLRLRREQCQMCKCTVCRENRSRDASFHEFRIFTRRYTVHRCYYILLTMNCVLCIATNCAVRFSNIRRYCQIDNS